LERNLSIILVFTIAGVTILCGFGFLQGVPIENAVSATNLEKITNTNSFYRLANVTVNGFHLLADVPTTDDQFQKGLDIKDHLKENQGMLFIFSQPAKYAFWMHGMKFPIDIIWIDSNNSVVRVEQNLPPCTIDLLCPTYSPDRDSLYVLETTANFSERHNVTVGTHLNYHIVR
jgi:uncharacterized membrane protein (UPF0127 family)